MSSTCFELDGSSSGRQFYIQLCYTPFYVHKWKDSGGKESVLEWILNNKLVWSLYTCLTQLYDGIDMYNLLHKEQLHVLALFIGHLQVDKWEILISSYTLFVWVVYSGDVRGGVGKRSGMCCVGWVVWVHGFCYISF